MASVNRNKLIQPRRQLTALLPLLSSSTALVPTVGAMLSRGAVGRQGGAKALRQNLHADVAEEKRENAEKSEIKIRPDAARNTKELPQGKGGGGEDGVHG